MDNILWMYIVDTDVMIRSIVKISFLLMLSHIDKVVIVTSDVLNKVQVVIL